MSVCVRCMFRYFFYYAVLHFLYIQYESVCLSFLRLVFRCASLVSFVVSFRSYLCCAPSRPPAVFLVYLTLPAS